MTDRDPRAAPLDPRDWAPMRAYRGRRRFDIKDPVAEPLWSGTRALARVTVDPGTERPATVELLAEGLDLAPELPELAAAIGRSVLARDAIVDGIISRQVTLDGVGAAAVPEVRSRPIEMLVRSDLHVDVTARGAVEQAAAAPGPVDGFIAVDLLRVDGTALLDVPLVERKRLLESVIGPSQLVRLSSYVRPPIGSWIATWKSVGLRGGILKAANSRYHPNDETIEWRIVERIERRR